MPQTTYPLTATPYPLLAATFSYFFVSFVLVCWMNGRAALTTRALRRPHIAANFTQMVLNIYSCTAVRLYAQVTSSDEFHCQIGNLHLESHRPVASGPITPRLPFLMLHLLYNIDTSLNIQQYKFRGCPFNVSFGHGEIWQKRTTLEA